VEAIERTADAQEREALLRKLDIIDEGIRNSATKEVAGFLIQPLLEELSGQGGRVQSLSDSLGQSRRMYLELEDAAEYHIRLFSGNL
jgi:hypothetical protein